MLQFLIEHLLLRLWPNRSVSNDINDLEIEKSNTIVGMTQLQGSSSSLNTLNTDGSSSSEIREPPLRKRRRTFMNNNIEPNNICSSERTEQITQALAKMIAINQIPLSFCSSSGFQQFMAIVEPNYLICKEGAIKRRLKAFKSSVEEQIKKQLRNAKSWCPKSYTLTTHQLEDRHTALNLTNQLETTFSKWEIEEKVMAVVTDNAKNVLNAVSSLINVTEKNDLTCSAHTLQLAVNNGLKYEKIEKLIELVLKSLAILNIQIWPLNV
ncbi:hypothetical protein QTP88_021151 [Uroleucon formosanum]